MKEENAIWSHRMFVKLALLTIITLLATICTKVHAQQWKDENQRLYPHSIALTINAKVESIGLIYAYLPRIPILNMPIGFYTQFSSTLPQSWHRPDYYNYNEYDWQRKYVLGVSLVLPTAFKDGETHTLVTLGAIYNELPPINSNKVLQPGQYDPDLEYTHKWGMDIGVRWAANHVVVHIKTDVFNFMGYTEFGIGYSFGCKYMNYKKCYK
jgi:hypothetical protein